MSPSNISSLSGLHILVTFSKDVSLAVWLPCPAHTPPLLSSLEQTEEGAASVSSIAATPSTATGSSDKAPVVKAKATHVLMNSLITSKQSTGGGEGAGSQLQMGPHI